MSFLSLSPRMSSIRTLNAGDLSLSPRVLVAPGEFRRELASLQSAGPAVYMALYLDRQCYVGVSGHVSARAGESPHLDQFGPIDQLFVIAEADGRLTLPMAEAAERIIWETMQDVARYATIGMIPRGSPMAETYDQLRAFCGRALQVIAASGRALTEIPPGDLLAGARGNSDLVVREDEEPIEGMLYRYTARGLSAHVVKTDKGDWILLAGSQVAGTPVPSAGPLLRVRLESMVYSGTLIPDPDWSEGLLTCEPLRFGSASGAALFVTGSKGGSPHWQRVGRVRSCITAPSSDLSPMQLH